ncbi:hypothetical protein AB0283_21100 [Micromonospora vinacea]|uniref:hypothetical protein n=1 Tax=Micromonospora vinacea TaxID=709878 RepID=UPI003450CFBF
MSRSTAVAVLRPGLRRILAAHSGVLRPDRWDVVGAGICLVGVVLIMYVPRSAGGS